MKELSASQISTFIGCNRRWGFEYLDGKRPPPHPSAALGSEIHSQLENWLKNKVMPTSSIAVTGVQHAPPPGIGVVEERISFATPNSLWRGAIDLHYDLEGGKSWLYRAPWTTGHTVIHDWKSSGNPKYNKTADDLAKDPQASLYAFWAFGKGAQVVEGHWVYLSTKGAPKASPVKVTFNKNRVDEEVGKLDLVAKDCQNLYQIRPKSSELAANLAQCSAYGGCPHRAYCDQGASKTMSSNDNSDFMAFINARAGAMPSIPSVPSAPPAIPSVPAIPGTFTVRVPFVPEMDEASASVFDYMVSTLKKSPEDALALLGIQVKAPSVPALPELPKPEAGFINPPEAANVQVLAEPPVVPPSESPKTVTRVKVEETPSAPDSLDTMDRDALKKIAVFLGVMDQSNRFGEPKIRQIIRGVNGWETKIQDMGRVALPVAVADSVQSEFEEKMKAVVAPSLAETLIAHGNAAMDAVVAEVTAPSSPVEQIGVSEELANSIPAIPALEKSLGGNDKLDMTAALPTAIREIVREEVRAALREFFSKLNG